MVAAQCGLDVGEFVWTGGDVHLYTIHLDQVKLQLKRETRNLPELVFREALPQFLTINTKIFLLKIIYPIRI